MMGKPDEIAQSGLSPISGMAHAIAGDGPESMGDSFLAFLAQAFPLGPADLTEFQRDQGAADGDIIDWLVETGRIDARIGHILLEFRGKIIGPQKARKAIEAIQYELAKASVMMNEVAETSPRIRRGKSEPSRAESVTQSDDSDLDSSSHNPFPLQTPIDHFGGTAPSSHDPHERTEVALKDTHPGFVRPPTTSDTPLPRRKEGVDSTDYEYLYGQKFGKYLICTGIGKGTMGAILLAHHQMLGKAVALKILNPTLARDDSFRERFFSEGRFAANIQHPALVHVFDCDERDGWLYLAMEYVDGMSGMELIRTVGYLPECQALMIARRIAEGLAAAHRHDIIHRDIKPGNILMAKKGSVKLTDLGLARTRGPRPGDTPDFEFGNVVGTPLYMAPEQSGPEGSYDHRADIYALGGTLYHLLCGSPPFEDHSVGGLLRKHAQAPVTPLTRRGTHVSARTSALVTWMLAKEPMERPASCDEVIREIDTCLGSAGSGWASGTRIQKMNQGKSTTTPFGLSQRISAMLQGNRTPNP